ncbi:MAG: hypothetical protein JXI43_13040, partial [Tissierellales bacterium]|nr:hypothetical protein [Tissierellales bacterium]
MNNTQPELPGMPDKPQGELFATNQSSKSKGPIYCLGMTFENEKDRRAYFTELLREKLKDPEFRSIEGFPIGEDEDILALSDPPYYTACPNPWIDDYIELWEAEKPEQPEGWTYHREPFASAVREGKYHPIYRIHSYGTKAPHRAIMKYILHYTNPGDIVFDGFCGTGMTGIAAKMCGNKKEIEDLGYIVREDGIIYQETLDSEGEKQYSPLSKIGSRKVILNDLSPIATYIAHNINSPLNYFEFENEARKIINEVEHECSWMYETKHTDGRLGEINYMVWSDVFICPSCSEEVIFWDSAIDKEGGKFLDEFYCENCKAKLSKNIIERAWITVFDDILNEKFTQAKQVPVLVNYSVDGSRYIKKPDKFDLELIQKIERLKIPYKVPTEHLPKGFNTDQPIKSHGISHVHHFYTKRNLWVFASIFDKIRNPDLTILVTKLLFRNTKMYLFSYQNGTWGAGGGTTAGNLFIPSLSKELNIFGRLNDSLKSRIMVRDYFNKSYDFSVSTSSMSKFAEIPDEVMDYIFLDPPFGSNLNYSEINFLWESWIKVWTNNKLEAIENTIQGKGINEYRKIMIKCFKEAYRLLKPGRWLTIEFSNTKAYVWNNIQSAIVESGFIISNVSVLDKKRGGFKSMTTPTAVKQDLIISAYKPNGGFINRFNQEAETEQGVWDFIQTHLSYLPVVKTNNNVLQHIPERDPRILYDQVVSYYVRNGFMVPVSSREFQAGLRQRFAERDGMMFLPQEVAEYDQAKLRL